MEKVEHLCGEIFGTDHYGQRNDQRSGVAHHTDSPRCYPMVAVELVIVVQSCLILLLEFGSSLSSEFVARKICHAGSGALMLLLDPREWMARWFGYSVVASSLAMTPACPPSLRLGSPSIYYWCVITPSTRVHTSIERGIEGSICCC